MKTPKIRCQIPWLTYFFDFSQFSTVIWLKRIADNISLRILLPLTIFEISGVQTKIITLSQYNEVWKEQDRIAFHFINGQLVSFQNKFLLWHGCSFKMILIIMKWRSSITNKISTKLVLRKLNGRIFILKTERARNGWWSSNTCTWRPVLRVYVWWRRCQLWE